MGAGANTGGPPPSASGAGRKQGRFPPQGVRSGGYGFSRPPPRPWSQRNQKRPDRRLQSSRRPPALPDAGTTADQPERVGIFSDPHGGRWQGFLNKDGVAQARAVQ